MKKAALMMVFVLAMGLFAGCGSSAPASSAAEDAGSAGEAATDGSGAGSVDLDSIKTLGDAFAIEGKDEYGEQRATYADLYVYAFTKEGVLYRVTADLSDELSEELFALEYDENYEENEKNLVKDLPVKSAENLMTQIIPQEELDKLVGKTGGELFDEGWRSGMFYNTNDMEFWLEKGPFAYSFHFDGEVPESEAEDFIVEEGLRDFKVLDVTYADIGDATFIDQA